MGSPQPLSVHDRRRARDLSVSTSSPSPRTVREQATDDLARSNFCAEIPRLMREPKNLNLFRGKACPLEKPSNEGNKGRQMPAGKTAAAKIVLEWTIGANGV